MEYVDYEKIRLERLQRIDRRLTILFLIILVLLSIFVIKFLLSAIISVEKAGVPLDSIIDIIKYHFVAFFESFGDLTCKYMIFVSLMLFINIVGLAANKILKVFTSKGFSFFLFVFSLVVVFSLPLDKTFLYFSEDGKTGLGVFCLVMMIPGPYLLGMSLGRTTISSLIISRVFYVIIYGLLVIQLFIEW